MSGGQMMSSEVLMYVLRFSFGASVVLFFLLVYLMVGDIQTPSRAPPAKHPTYLNTNYHLNKDGVNAYSKS